MKEEELPLHMIFTSNFLLTIVFLYLLMINIAGFAIMAIDKRRAVKHKWRVPERRLFLFSILGGSFGTMMGMFLCHHKTKHWYFRLGMPLIFVLHLVCLYMILHLQYVI